MATRTMNKATPLVVTYTPRKKKRTLVEILLDVLKYTILIVLSISYLLPFYWMFTSALKNDSQIYTIPPVWIPNPAMWENFWNAWTTYNFNLYLFNTVFKYALPVAIGTVVSSSIVAYGFGRLRWKSREFLFAICLSTMMVPFQVTMVPLFIIFKKMGWINTFLPLVVPAFFGNPFNIFLLRQFFRSIPEDLLDAARIDGANELGVLFRVVLPLSKPVLTVVALFAVMGAWNDFLGPLIYLNNSKNYTLAIGIESLRRTISSVGSVALAYPYLMAVSTIVTIPIILLFFFAQRTFIEGITLTGMKG